MAGNLSYVEAKARMEEMLADPLWLGLLYSFPGPGGTAFEVSTIGTGYGRVRVDTLFSAVDTTGRATLLQPVEFAEATSLWGTIPAFGLFSAETAGTRRRQMLFPTPRFIDVGSPPLVIAAGSISLDFS